MTVPSLLKLEFDIVVCLVVIADSFAEHVFLGSI